MLIRFFKEDGRSEPWEVHGEGNCRVSFKGLELQVDDDLWSVVAEFEPPSSGPVSCWHNLVWHPVEAPSDDWYDGFTIEVGK
jgi:hypothetical protein